MYQHSNKINQSHLCFSCIDKYEYVLQAFLMMDSSLEIRMAKKRLWSTLTSSDCFTLSYFKGFDLQSNDLRHLTEKYIFH